MSLAPAAPTDLETVKTAIRSMLDYHQQEAQRLETALSVLEQTFPLSAPLSEAGAIAGEDQNGSAQVSEAKSLVLNQIDAELLSESSNSPTASQKKSRKSKSTQAKASAPASEPVEPAPVEAAAPKAAPKATSFSLLKNLRATYQKYDDLNAVIVEALSKFEDAVEIPDLVDELYGRNLKKDFRPRAVGSLTRQLNKGAKAGLWQSVEGEAGETPAFAALD